MRAPDPLMTGHSGPTGVPLSRLKTAVVQLVEHRSPKPSVGGSSPSCRASFFFDQRYKFMQFLEFFKIGGSWIASGIAYALLAVLGVLIIRNYSRIAGFTGEVKGELRKASWPWESDPKIKGFRKYKDKCILSQL